jgi:hypothetical protein
VQLTFDAEVEAFRAEFIEFLDDHLPSEAEAATEPSRSTAHVPDWARRWQQLQFDHGWLLPGNPPHSVAETPASSSSSSIAMNSHGVGSITRSTRRASASSPLRC